MRDYTKPANLSVRPIEPALHPVVAVFFDGLDLSPRATASLSMAIRELRLHTVEAVIFYLRGVANGNMPCPHAGERVRAELREKLRAMA
jgi:hypothetical protein